MGFHSWVRYVKIRLTPLFIPDEVFAPQFKEPIVHHPVVISPDRSDVPMYVCVPCPLSGVFADMLQIAKPWNPYHPGLQKCPDYELIVVCNMKLLIVTPIDS
jgi:hypothetical protein